MCGIVGVLRTDGGRADEDELRRMAHALRHRGPDASGFHVDGPLGFGHQRLSIIDLEGGAQPMFNEDGRIVLTYNGEVYNHHELAERLRTNHRFATRSDTEAIVHGYEEWGDDVVHELSGFFAFALWDAGRERLLLARDRIGKKPLYFARLGDRFLFASELRALLAVHPERPGPDPHALRDVLTLRHVGAGRTGFQGIEELLPGERLVVRGGHVERTRWWTPPLPDPGGATLEEALAEFRARFDRAVGARLEADVPLGLLLSGGLDSSAVLAAMSRVASGRLSTFTLSFTREKESEGTFARRLAEHFSTDHHEFVLTESDLLGAVDRLLPQLDTPSATPRSCRPRWCASSPGAASPSACPGTAATSCSVATRATRRRWRAAATRVRPRGASRRTTAPPRCRATA